MTVPARAATGSSSNARRERFSATRFDVMLDPKASCPGLEALQPLRRKGSLIAPGLQQYGSDDGGDDDYQEGRRCKIDPPTLRADRPLSLVLL